MSELENMLLEAAHRELNDRNLSSGALAGSAFRGRLANVEVTTPNLPGTLMKNDNKPYRRVSMNERVINEIKVATSSVNMESIEHSIRR